MADPLEPMKKLARRLRDDTARRGLRQVAFAVLPNLEGDEPSRVRGAFIIGSPPDPDADTIAGILAATADADLPDHDT